MIAKGSKTSKCCRRRAKRANAADDEQNEQMVANASEDEQNEQMLANAANNKTKTKTETETETESKTKTKTETEKRDIMSCTEGCRTCRPLLRR